MKAWNVLWYAYIVCFCVVVSCCSNYAVNFASEELSTCEYHVHIASPVFVNSRDFSCKYFDVSCEYFSSDVFVSVHNYEYGCHMESFGDLSALYDSAYLTDLEYSIDISVTTDTELNIMAEASNTSSSRTPPSSSAKIPLPKYNPDKAFELFKTELTLWDKVTDVPKENVQLLLF